MTKLNIIHAALLMASLISCVNCLAQSKSHKERMEEVTKAIAQSNAIYFQSFVENDPSIFTDRYAEDACIMAPFAPQVCGKENAEKFFRDAYDNYGLRNGKFITTAIYGDASEYVTEEGLWQSFDAKGELFDDGKFLVLWKWTGEGWKMYRDSFSSNRQQTALRNE
jgi:ketosteroid isomerase-like protein